jgi:hypothetical protein
VSYIAIQTGKTASQSIDPDQGILSRELLRKERTYPKVPPVLRTLDFNFRSRVGRVKNSKQGSDQMRPAPGERKLCGRSKFEDMVKIVGRQVSQEIIRWQNPHNELKCNELVRGKN